MKYEGFSILECDAKDPHNWFTDDVVSSSSKCPRKIKHISVRAAVRSAQCELGILPYVTETSCTRQLVHYIHIKLRIK